VVAALKAGRTSWTALLDAVRLEPGADVADVTTPRFAMSSRGWWQPASGRTVVVLDA
jgi:hypothetical protein